MWPLKGHDGGFFGQVFHLHRAIGRKVFGEPSPHDVDHGGVGDTQNFGLAHHGKNHVVNEKAILIQKVGVSAPWRLDGGDALGCDTLQPRSNILAGKPE